MPRGDIDSVKIGQKATARLIALNQRTTPILNGTVEYVSADAVASDTGQQARREAYVVRVSLTPAELARVQNFAPKPGMPVEIMIKTEERTFAQYIAKPVLDSMSRAFRERGGSVCGQGMGASRRDRQSNPATRVLSPPEGGPS